jgi:4-amino-4-deoxy-L-arabinose transferase-like glycosyltransferase
LHAIGSADVVTLHLQYWFLAVGFVAALLGLLATRVTPLVLLPFVSMVFVMPDIRSRSVDMYGDLPLGFFIATAALLVALWLEERREWWLPAASLLVAAAALTKREGVILAGCVVVAGLVASADRARKDWPRLLAVLLAAVGATLLWQIWLRAKGLPSNGPSGGLHFLTDLRRGWDSLHVVMNNLFTFDLWLLSLTIALAAAGLCLLVRAWRLALYLAALIVASVLGCAVILWSDPNLQLTDVNVVSRLVGTVALTAVAITPLALQRAWDAGEGPSRVVAVQRAPFWQAAFAWGLVVAAAIAYPATLLAEGGARFPSASDCVHAPPPSGSVLVVFGHAASYDDALRLRSRALALGTKPIRLAQDGCGRILVSLAAASSTQGEEIIRRARTAGLSAALEAESST